MYTRMIQDDIFRLNAVYFPRSKMRFPYTSVNTLQTTVLLVSRVPYKLYTLAMLQNLCLEHMLHNCKKSAI